MKAIAPVVLCVLFLSAVTAVAGQDAATAPPAQIGAVPSAVVAQATPTKIDSGDTAWVLISAAMVMLMTPGLAFFYGGLVRRKNILGVLMQCFIALAALSIQWMLFGYSLSFAPGNGFIGGTQWFGLKGVGLEPYAYAPTIPHQAFMIFQAMFAVITPALIIGAFAERMKFSAYLIFTLLWATLVYDPITHWVWGSGGWLKTMGVLDFAGGVVVHINAGIAALVTAIVIGRRKSFERHPVPPHNLPMSVMGAAILWFGWFGFNAGSALAANGIAVNAFVVTNAAGAIAALTWAFLDWKFNKAPTMLGTISGAVAGLAAVTPAAGYVDFTGAIVIGIVASILCFIAVGYIKHIFCYDDSLDAFGVHGISGIWGTLATGLFAVKAIGGADGLFYGNPHQLWVQFIATAATTGYAFVVTLIIYKLVDIFVGVRVAEKDEAMGLDLTQHNERAYTMLE
jgi:Amt family ammonium transporter